MMLEQLPLAADAEEVRRIRASIDLGNPTAILEFGAATQTKLVTFADAVLAQVRSADSGAVGQELHALLDRLNGLDVESLNRRPGLVDRLLGRAERMLDQFLRRFDTLSGEVEAIARRLEKACDLLLKDIVTLNRLFEHNLDNFRALTAYILAGEAALQEQEERVLPALREAAEAAPAATRHIKAQELQDLTSRVERFARKLHDLRLARTMTIQAMPQIRMVQTNNEALVEKIQGSLLHAIPLWKNQLVIAISLHRQKEALEAQRAVSDTTNALLTKNAELLRQGSVEVQREAERGLVDIETLRKANEELIATIDEVLRIQEEGRKARAAAEQELTEVEAELRRRLLQTEPSGGGRAR
ncbi:MAG TPA: toxic anion resistance protein [Alphaproteobacteria bacterium]